jgi:hypothetical protein
MKTRYFWSIAILLIGIGVFGGAKEALNAKPPPSNASLSGGYSGVFSGFLWFTPPAATPYKSDVALTNLMTFDGAGNESGSFTSTFGVTFGAFPLSVCEGTTTGTYNVNPDGTGSITFVGTSTSGGCAQTTATETFVLGNSGKLINGVLTSASVPPAAGTVNSYVLSGTQTRQ